MTKYVGGMYLLEYERLAPLCTKKRNSNTGTLRATIYEYFERNNREKKDVIFVSFSYK